MDRRTGRVVAAALAGLALLAILVAGSACQARGPEPAMSPPTPPPWNPDAGDAPNPGGAERASTPTPPVAGRDEVWVIAKPEAATMVAGAQGAVPANSIVRSNFDLPARVGDSENAARFRQRAREALSVVPTAWDDHSIGTGAMLASFPARARIGAPHYVPLPLEHTAVEAAIEGHISTVAVNQRFENPFDTKIEAVYLFPLPEKAAVSEFLMVIGERTIRGIVREKAEAEEIYRQARAQGYRASLLVQHRPNVFEQKVANIEPGKSIEVDITYFHTLAYKDGWYSFVFPTVVGPRFNPPGHADPVGAVRRGSERGDATRVEYLAPNERSGHDISIRLDIDAGVEIEDLKSTHRVDVERPSSNVASVALGNEKTLPNRDFVLDFRVAGEAVKSKLLTHRDPDTGDGFFSLMLIPPRVSSDIERHPLELVFVIDASGSMRGRPLEQAKEAVGTALDRLGGDDTFQIIRFSEGASRFGAMPVRATPANIGRARDYLADLRSGGGTYMVEGVKAALDFPHDPARLRFVSFMTDGYIGNESDILAAIHRRLGASRIFSFGVGSSVNRYLLERMAGTGRGVVAYLGLDDSARTVMGDFLDRVSHPALTDIEIDWGGMRVANAYPVAIPDLFVGRPLVVTGKFTGDPETVTVSARAGGEALTVAVDADGDTDRPSLAKVWARERIAELTDHLAWAGDPGRELQDTITTTALAHQLMSSYTSFVAVDSRARTAGDHGVTVHQAVPVPDGVRYSTTVD